MIPFLSGKDLSFAWKRLLGVTGVFYSFPQPLRENFDDNQPTPNSRTRYRCPVKNMEKPSNPFLVLYKSFLRGWHISYLIVYGYFWGVCSGFSINVPFLVFFKHHLDWLHMKGIHLKGFMMFKKREDMKYMNLPKPVKLTYSLNIGIDKPKGWSP